VTIDLIPALVFTTGSHWFPFGHLADIALTAELVGRRSNRGHVGPFTDKQSPSQKSYPRGSLDRLSYRRVLGQSQVRAFCAAV
jgi:hypothetical protein